MAGQIGERAGATTLNLEVVEGDAERNLLLVKGAVPGPNGGLVFVRNAVKAGCEVTTLTVRNQSGGDAGSVELPEAIFGIEPNVAVMHQVVTAQLAGRAAPARTAPRPAPRCAVVAPSRGARRAPAGPGRAPSARRTGAAVAWPTARSRARYRSALPRRW